MSYDGWIEMPDPDTSDKGAVIPLYEIGNYTSNVSVMWRRALQATTGQDLALGELDGWTCSRAFPVLDRAVTVMEERAEELRALEPANGWGDYGGALLYMRKAAEAARLFRSIPEAVIRWNR